MPALVNALNKVLLPTLGKPTMPHFKLMKISLGNNPLCTIEPNAGIVEVPDPRMAGTDSKKCKPGTNTSVFRGFCPRFA
jgi:ribosome-binding ATPase YchF (GTP1/OBG family)